MERSHESRAAQVVPRLKSCSILLLIKEAGRLMNWRSRIWSMDRRYWYGSDKRSSNLEQLERGVEEIVGYPLDYRYYKSLLN